MKLHCIAAMQNNGNAKQGVTVQCVATLATDCNAFAMHGKNYFQCTAKVAMQGKLNFQCTATVATQCNMRPTGGKD